MDKINTLKQVIETNKKHAKENPYMRGLANGLILALAILEDKEPEYIPLEEVENGYTNNDKD